MKYSICQTAHLFTKLVLFIVVFVAAVDAKSSPSKPNIVLIMLDDLSPRIGAYGDSIAHTPNIDALAAEGVTFMNAYATSPVCGPSRSAVITGVYPQRLGTMHHRTRGITGSNAGGPIAYEAVPPSYIKAFPELLRAAGYYTVLTGKRDYQFGEPFTIWDRSGDIDWREHPPNQPLFAFINLHHTHEGYLWPEEFDPEKIIQGVPRYGLTIRRNRQEFAQKSHITNPMMVPVPPYLPDTPVVREDLARHYDNIAFDDIHVGEILSELKRLGKWENTIVILTSDQGDPLPRSKRTVYASGLRVPLLVRFPGREDGGQQLMELVSLVDLAPTILGMAGVNVPDFIDGLDLFDALALEERSFVFGGLDRYDRLAERQRTVINERFQYIRNYLPNKPLFRRSPYRDVLPTMGELWRLNELAQLSPIQSSYFAPRPMEELYNLVEDPHSVNNLIANPEYAHRLGDMRQALEIWESSTGDLGRIPELELVQQMWPGLEQPVTAMPVIELIDTEGEKVLKIESGNNGVSIGYRFTKPEPEDQDWLLYTGLVQLPDKFSGYIWAKAIRYGYRESSVKVVQIP